MVNAQYIPSINSIYIPAAYIQKPFVDLDTRTIAYNLANIGFTIAHELSHALDNRGSKYDKNGNRRDWWTDQDKQNYKKIQNNILKQYEAWAKRDGFKYDAKKTIDEDIADISGLAICNEFLRDYVTNVADNAILQIPFYKLFFINFAINLRQKLLNEVSQLIENTHPPDVYRCNIPLSRSLLFRGLYNIKKGDKMWWHSTNQVW
jgi:putative endopeptidase